MSRTVRIDVLPDAEGGYTVSRDRVVDGHFDDATAAVEYAEQCVSRAKRAGQDVQLTVRLPVEAGAPVAQAGSS